MFAFDNDFPKEFNAGKVVLGFCGDSRTIPTCLEYILNGGKKPRVSGIEMLVLTDKKEIWTGTSFTNWVQHDVNYFSIGSGSMFALGAMAAGASPEEAIEKASELDVYTGLGITKESL